MNYDSAQPFREYVATGSTKYEAKEYKKTHLFFGNGAKFEKTNDIEPIEYTGNEGQTNQYVYVSAVLTLGPRKVPQ